MNSFGRVFRLSIFGESHGSGVGIVLDGVPAGIDLSDDDFTKDMKRRNFLEKGTTARKEDSFDISSGVFNNHTTGAPLCMFFKNNDVDSAPYENIKNIPRPGHADFVAFKKFKGFNDYRGGGHFSGRLTTAIVAAGIVAKKVLKEISIEAKLVDSGDIEKALRDNDSVGGIIECRVMGLPVGLGEPFFDSTESMLSHLLFSIPGIKGVEFGAGFVSAEMLGSEYNDQYVFSDGSTATNNSGGINGGITNGNELVFRVAVRPTASIAKAQKSFNIKTGTEETLTIEGRHDTCFATRVPVIVEAAAAIVLADLFLLSPGIKEV